MAPPLAFFGVAEQAIALPDPPFAAADPTQPDSRPARTIPKRTTRFIARTLRISREGHPRP
jgi:hypothetical protein